MGVIDSRDTLHNTAGQLVAKQEAVASMKFRASKLSKAYVCKCEQMDLWQRYHLLGNLGIILLISLHRERPASFNQRRDEGTPASSVNLRGRLFS